MARVGGPLSERELSEYVKVIDFDVQFWKAVIDNGALER